MAQARAALLFFFSSKMNLMNVHFTRRDFFFRLSSSALVLFCFVFVVVVVVASTQAKRKEIQSTRWYLINRWRGVRNGQESLGVRFHVAGERALFHPSAHNRNSGEEKKRSRKGGRT